MPAPVRRLAAGLLLLLVVAAGLAAFDAVRSWRAERALADEVAVTAVLGVDVASSAGGGRGRVDHYVAVRNQAPRTATVTGVRIERGRLRVRGRPVGNGSAAPGQDVYVPLSVVLDCSRPEPLPRGPELPGSVEVVTSSGRTVREPVVFSGAEALTAAVRTLCRLHTELVLQLSGPVR